MPKKPLNPCKHPGCPLLTEQKFCDKHKHQYERPTASEHGYDYKWQVARKKFLKEYPLCAKCQEKNKLTRATVVDHIIPHRGDGTLFWDKSNWQALCKRCHDKKTMTEDKSQEYKY
jgi:5-methylcytosine-specific restriction protein A